MVIERVYNCAVALGCPVINMHKQVVPLAQSLLIVWNIFSTLLQKHCNKEQETEECNLKLCGYHTPKVLIPIRLVMKRELVFYRLLVLVCCPSIWQDSKVWFLN